MARRDIRLLLDNQLDIMAKTRRSVGVRVMQGKSSKIWQVMRSLEFVTSSTRGEASSFQDARFMLVCPSIRESHPMVQTGRARARPTTAPSSLLACRVPLGPIKAEWAVPRSTSNASPGGTIRDPPGWMRPGLSEPFRMYVYVFPAWCSMSKRNPSRNNPLPPVLLGEVEVAVADDSSSYKRGSLTRGATHHHADHGVPRRSVAYRGPNQA